LELDGSRALHLEDAINVGRRMSIELRARGALVSHEEAKFLFRPHRPHDRKSHERQQNTGRVSRKNVGLDTPTTSSEIPIVPSVTARTLRNIGD
jgi:hypothetical protein